MSVRVCVRKSYKGYPYSVEAELSDLKQIDEIGKVVGAVEEWIEQQIKESVSSR